MLCLLTERARSMLRELKTGKKLPFRHDHDARDECMFCAPNVV